MKTVLLVPGFREGITSRDYKSVIKAIESKGYKVRFVSINWRRTVLTDWVAELNAIYSDYNPQDTIIAGFSYGAMTAFVSAAERNPAGLWLFSLSPYFADDMPKMKKSWLQDIGHRRADVFRNCNFNVMAELITCETLIFVGEIETKKFPLLSTRAAAAHELIGNSSLVVIPAVGHDVADKEYILSIQESIRI